MKIKFLNKIYLPSTFNPSVPAIYISSILKMKVFIFYAQHAAPAVFIFYAQHAAPAVTLQCAKLGGDSNILTSPTPRLSTLAMHFMCSDFSEEASFRRYE